MYSVANVLYHRAWALEEKFVKTSVVSFERNEPQETKFVDAVFMLQKEISLIEKKYLCGFSTHAISRTFI